MPIIDASLVVAVALRDDRAPAVQALLETWIDADEELHAPALLPYEFASGLTRAVVAGDLAAELLPAAWKSLIALPLTYHPLGPSGEAAVAIARSLDRHSAYDAAYIALAQALETEVWTFDAKLARSGARLGYPVRLVDPAP